MKIDKFDGEYRFLSNFYGCQLEFNGWIFQSAEHAYQACKSVDPKDWRSIQFMTAGQAKRAGQRFKLIPNWEQVKLENMREILIVKFAIPHLREKLISTGNAELIEGNTWGDTYWGVCNGRGYNHLGKLLMEIRG